MSDDRSTTPDGEQTANRPPQYQPKNTFGSRMGTAGMPTEKLDDFAGTLRNLLGRLYQSGRWVAVAVPVAAVAAVSLQVIGPKVLGHATDVIISGLRAGRLDFGWLAEVLGVGIALYLVAAFCAWLMNWLLTGMVQRTMYRMRGDVEDKIHRLPLAYLDAQARGDLLSRVTNDIDNVAQTMQQTLSQLLMSVLTVAGVLAMMLWISALMAVITMVVIPLSLVVTRLITRRSQGRFVAQWRHTGALNAQIEESFTGHNLVKVFGRQRHAEATFAEHNEQLYRASFWAQFLAGTIQPLMMFLGNLNFVAIAVVGGLRVSSGAITIGDVQAFIQYSRLFTQPMTQMASMLNIVQSGVASAERVFQFLAADEESAERHEATLGAEPRGRVAFEHVSFSYDPAVALIADLSLVAEPGQTVAIVGRTGAGKTTLVNLVMRFYELNGGRITIDGVDITMMPRAELRSHTGMVLQDTWLFGGTIRDNIAYGNDTATDEQILAAARDAYVDRFVHSLPHGYETVLDDAATNLSAGERQLITIARAFLADPTILILDEATSSVDTRTELLIQRATARLRSTRTSFIIAHRLSTIRDADLILVMDGGRIVEQGNHHELLLRRSAYYDLYNAQFAAPIDDSGAAT